MKTCRHLLLALLFASVPAAFAQDYHYDSKEPCIEVKNPHSSPWKFEFALPTWAFWSDLTLANDNVAVSTEYPFDEAIKDITGLFVFDFDAEYERFNYNLYFAYFSVKPSQSFPGRQVVERVDVDLALTKLEQYITFKLVDCDRLKVWVGGGLRYNQTETTLTVLTAGPRSGLSRSANLEFWDLVAAGEVKYCVSDRIFFRALGDWGGTDSEETYQFRIGGGVYLNPCWYLSLEYRQYYLRSSNGNATLEMEQKGPQVGIHRVF